MISISINVDLIDKKRFFKGKKGRYLDLTLWETPESEYGDYMVKQRGDRGEKMPILGNGKIFENTSKKKTKKKDNDDDEQNTGDEDDW